MPPAPTRQLYINCKYMSTKNDKTIRTEIIVMDNNIDQ